MPLITFDEIHAAGRQRYAKRFATKTAASILEEDTKRCPMDHSFDVFLSHSYSDVKLDRKHLLDLKAYLEDFQLEVYVDWIIDNDLERETVSAKTAQTLRIRMNNSRCLLFATSDNSQNSKWMPWELGYMDGRIQRVAILPLTGTTNKMSFTGQEYLRVYPYLAASEANNSTDVYLWVCNNRNTYVRFDLWLNGQNPTKRIDS